MLFNLFPLIRIVRESFVCKLLCELLFIWLIMLILFKLFSSIQILSILIIILFIVFSGLLFVTIQVFLMFTLFPISILKLSVSMTSPRSPFMSICISYYYPFAFFLFLFLLVQFLPLIHSFFITLDNL